MNGKITACLNSAQRQQRTEEDCIAGHDKEEQRESNNEMPSIQPEEWSVVPQRHEGRLALM